MICSREKQREREPNCCRSESRAGRDARPRDLVRLYSRREREREAFFLCRLGVPKTKSDAGKAAVLPPSGEAELEWIGDHVRTVAVSAPAKGENRKGARTTQNSSAEASPGRLFFDSSREEKEEKRRKKHEEKRRKKSFFGVKCFFVLAQGWRARAGR